MHKLYALMTVGAVFAAGCKKKDEDKKPADDKAAPAPVATDKTPPPPPPPASGTPVTVDPEIAKMVKAIVDNCQVDDTYFSVSSCKNNEDYAILNYAVDKKLTTTFESLGEIAVTDGAKDKKVLAAIVGTWNSFQDHDIQKANSTPAAAERVLKIYPLLPADADRFAYAVGIPLIAGKQAELTAVLMKLPDGRLKRSSFQSYLDWGGVKALPDVQAFYKAATADEDKGAAAWSVGVAVYQPVPDPDKTTMCDWVKSIAADESVGDWTLAQANASLGRCKGTYIDAALDAIEKRIAKSKISDPTANALHQQCWSEGVIGGVINGSPEQCKRALDILDKAVADPDAPPAGVRQALWVIGNVAKNGNLQKEGKAILDKFKGAKDEQVAKQAADSLKELQ